MERKVAFEDVVVAIQSGNLLAVLEHPNQDKYPGQKMFIVNIKNYTFCIPFVETDDEIFLKTIFPNRKFMHLLLRN